MKQTRQDKEPVGLGASISLAVVGVIVAGLGLVTMRSAFPPLPKAETPVVLVHAEHPVLNTAYHAAISAPEPTVQSDEATDGGSDADLTAHKAAHRTHVRRRERAVARLEIRPGASRAEVRPAATPASAPEKIAALTNADDGKLCKAPTPNAVAAKVLQPGLILRYDPQLTATPIDIPPPKPPPEEERRLKLSALLADVLNN